MKNYSKMMEKNDPIIHVHPTVDPFKGKKIRIMKYQKGTSLNSYKDVEINSKEEFQTLLEEVKQYNSEKENEELGLTKRLITL